MAKVTIAEKGKKETINRYLIDEYVLIHIKPEVSGVTIPEHLRAQPSVTLKISKFFRGSLSLLEEQIETELKFSGEYFNCIVPYNSIWAITTIKEESLIWPSDAPVGSELVLNVPAATLKPKAEPALEEGAALPKAEEKPTKGSHLKRIK